MSNEEKIFEMLNSIQEEGRAVLTEYESKEVLSNYDIPVAESRLTNNKMEAVEAARSLKYPVVVKVNSPEITNRDEAGGVRVGLTSELEVRQAFEDVTVNAKSYKKEIDIHGVLLQKYIPDAQEIVMGVTQDQSFGPTVTFSLGGVWLEVLEDVSFRLAPVSEEDAEDMIKEISGYSVLSDNQEGASVDIDALTDIIQKMSELPMKYEDISEIELGPVFALEDRAVVVDARITFKETEEEDEREN